MGIHSTRLLLSGDVARTPKLSWGGLLIPPRGMPDHKN